MLATSLLAETSGNEYADSTRPTMKEDQTTSLGGCMGYQVSHEGRFVSVFSADVTDEELQGYREKGYVIAYFIRGNTPLVDVMRCIVLNRCKQQ